MSRPVVPVVGLLAASLTCITAAAAELEFDHVWIVVTRDAPERVALERAGLTFDAGRKAQTKDLRPDLPLIIHY